MPASRLLGLALLILPLASIEAEPIRVTGRVVSRSPQSALAGVRVDLFRVDPGEQAPLVSTRTGADGSFEIAAPESGGFRLTARKEGYVEMDLPFLPLVEDAEVPVAVLVRGTPLEARTVGADGRALAGVEVELSLLLRWRPEGAEESPSEWRPACQRSVSDKDGRLTLLGIFEGSAELTATSPPYRGQTARWTDPFSPLVLRLSSRQAAAGEARVPPRPPRRIAGKVVDLASGRPLAGALVWSGWPLLAPVARTDAEGAFQMELPLDQDIWLAAAAAGYFPGERLSPRPGASDPILLKLTPSATVSGVVVDATGQAVSGVRLVADPPIARGDSYGGGPRWATARSRADGAFRLTGLRPGGTYELTAAREGFARTRTTARTAAAGRSSAPVRIVLSGGKIAFGRIVDESGQPIAGAEVTLVNPVSEDAATISGPEGKFEFRHLDPGTRDLLVRAEGCGRVHRTDIEIPSGAPAIDLGVVTLPAGAWIEGRVTDPRGTPIEDAAVRLVASGPDAEIWEAATGRIFEELRTGPAGRFRATGLQRGIRHQIVVDHPGYAQVWLSDVTAPTVEPLRIELKPAHVFAGRVLGPGGEPVPGASLASVRELRTGGSSMGSSTRLGETDAEGRFRVSRLSPGPLNLEVWAEGYGSRRVPGLQIPEEGDLEGVEIVLQRGASFEVVVRDSEGEPMPAVHVDAMLEREARQPADSTSDRGFCQTDPQGRCRLSVQSPGAYRVSASQGNRSASMVATATTEGAVVELRLPPGFDVSGWVRGTDGGGAPGVSVQLDTDHGGSTIQTEADGTFAFEGLPEGTYRLSARDRRGRASDPLQVELARQSVRNLELKLDRERGGATLTGRILGLAPEVLRWVSVTALPAALPAATRFDPSRRLSPDGRYRIEGLEPGDWKVEAQTPNGRRTEATMRIEPGATEATLDLEFPPGILSLSGRVLVDGAPLAGAEIGVSTPTHSSLGGFRTGWDGSFALHDLEPGPLTLQFFGGDGIVASRTFQLEESLEVQIDLVTGRLRGIILSVSGEPLEDAVVTVESVLSPGGTLGRAAVSALTLSSGPDGAFVAPRLVSGRYRISIRKDGFTANEATVEVPPNGEGIVELRLAPKGGA